MVDWKSADFLGAEDGSVISSDLRREAGTPKPIKSCPAYRWSP